MMRRIVVAGGGTGGHLFPGIALVEEIRRRYEVDVLFMGTKKGIEARLLPLKGEKLEFLDVMSLKGSSGKRLFRSLSRLPGAMARAASIFRRHHSDLVIGVGGYVSGPALAAAAAMGIPTALLEQNAHPGMTNRMLSSVVGRAYLTFEETAVYFGKKARVLGNPVRREFSIAARRAITDPIGFESRARHVLVLGGSQGSRALNETVPDALSRLPRGMKVLHQTGESMREEVKSRYQTHGVEAEVVPFIEDMASAYTEAALVIARAGATTLSELCAVGRPSILIPYPHAADDHQTKNARSLERDGAAICFSQNELDVTTLRQSVHQLLGDPNRMRAMSKAARSRGKPEAAASIVDDLSEWLGWEAFMPKIRPEIENEGRSETQRVMLRGTRFYQPRFNPSLTVPRRPLVFEDSFAWE